MRPSNDKDLHAHHVCPWWLAYTFDNPLRRFLHDPQKLLSPYARAGMTVVDIGCGMGYFSIGLARLVGDEGAVISVDLQQEMLDITRRRAEKARVAQRILQIMGKQGDIGINEGVKADFVLAFWMVHEVEDMRRFFDQVKSILKPKGVFLIVEPRVHVSGRRFKGMLDIARDAGFHTDNAPPVSWSRAVLLRK